MPFAVRVGFVILAHLFVLVKYFFHLFDSVPGSLSMIPRLPVSASFDELLYLIVFAIFCQVLFSRSLSNGERGI